jgi:hypothetical protein
MDHPSRYVNSYARQEEATDWRQDDAQLPIRLPGTGNWLNSLVKRDLEYLINAAALDVSG